MTVMLGRMVHLTTGFLDTIDDAVVGDSVAGQAGSLSYGGQLGGYVVLGNGNKQWKNNQLYAGIYQYVRFKAGTTAANARGNALYWDDISLYQVTVDPPTSISPFAGVGLNVVSKGDYGFIQIAGLATVQYRSTVTDATIGNIVVVTSGAVTFDAIAAATAVTGSILSRFVGIAHETPTNSGLKLVQLWRTFYNFAE